MTLDQNASVFMEEHGEPMGLPLVILHPLAMDHRSMKAWLEPLFLTRKGFRRIYVDIPAHGKSELPEWANTTDDLLTLLLDALHTLLQGRPFALLGMSFGGYLAQGLLGRLAAQVRGCCLLCPVTYSTVRNVPGRVVLSRDPDVTEGLDPDAAVAFETLFVHQTMKNREAFSKEIQPGRLLANRPFLASAWRTEGYHFSEAPFTRDTLFPQPALILTGRHDWIVGYEDQSALSAQFSQGHFFVLEQAGHMIQIEQRALVQKHVADWLTRLQD
ncbi:MAG: alpha/beta fold hydrolase [Clostridia bacterium]